MSGADPCTASNIAISSPILAPGATPSPPTSPAAKSDSISPYKFIVTITLYFSGLVTNCIHILSIIVSSTLISGYELDNSLATSRNSPSVIFKMFALWTTVTVSKLLFLAYSNALFKIR